MAITKEVLDELMKEYKGTDGFYGPDGLVKQLRKALTERMMGAELTEQTGYGKSESGKAASSRRNEKTSKTPRMAQGPMEIEVPRDRDSEHEPLVVRKRRREWRGFDNKILPVRSLGLPTTTVQENLKDIYSRITKMEKIAGDSIFTVAATATLHPRDNKDIMRSLNGGTFFALSS